MDIQTIPDASNQGVRDWHRKLPQLFMARQILLTLGVVGNYQHIAVNASAGDPSGTIKVQESLFSTLKSVDAVSLMLQNFRSGANNILEKLKIAYLYLLDGFPDFAQNDIAAISTDVVAMRQSAEKALADINKTGKCLQDAEQYLLTQNGRSAKLEEMQGQIDALTDRYVHIKREIQGREHSKEEHPWTLGDKQTVDFGTFMQSNILAFCKDWISLLITLVVLAGFYVHVVCTPPYCENRYEQHEQQISGTEMSTGENTKSAICGWEILLLSITLYILRFVIWKLVRPRDTLYTPVVQFIIVLVVLASFSSQILLPCQLYRFAFVLAAPLLVILVSFVIFLLAPKSVFFSLNKAPDMKEPLNMPVSAIKSPKEQLEAVQDARIDKLQEKNKIECERDDLQLAKCYVEKGLRDLKAVSGIVQQCTSVVEKWYQECKDIVEPSFARNIRQAEQVRPENRKEYWNSMAFKKEVMGFYCRWKALEVYCEDLRNETRTKRRDLEVMYTDNPYPKDAIIQAWEQAAQDSDRVVASLVQQHDQHLRDSNGHALTRLVNGSKTDVRLTMD